MDLVVIAAHARPDVLLQRNHRIVVPYRNGRKAVYGIYQTVTAIARGHHRRRGDDLLNRHSRRVFTR
jgi:hypothetical protein